MGIYTNEEWRPSRVTRIIESVETSTGATRVVTDAGEAYCKPLGNRQGPCVLASEWVCVRLAQWLGLPTFDAAIVELDEEMTFPLPAHKGHSYHAERGPCFLTRWTAGDKWDRTALQLGRLSNVGDLSRLVVFDTWVLNRDRHYPDSAVRHPNHDNVFLAFEDGGAGLRVIAMDHTHCFGLKGGDELTVQLMERGVRDDLIYGMFPEFEGYMNMGTVSTSCQKLSSVEGSAIDPIIAEVPQEWQVSVEARKRWGTMIAERARYLGATLGARIEAHLNRQGSV